MPTKKKTTKKKTTKKKTTTATAEPAGLQHHSPLGRALLSMIRLYLDELDFVNDDREAGQAELVRGFLQRREWGVEYSSLRRLEDDIVHVLSDGVQLNDGAANEVRRLASALVDRVFRVKDQRLQELVPKAVAEVVAASKSKATSRASSRPAASSKSKATSRASSKSKATSRASSRPTATSRASSRPTATSRASSKSKATSRASSKPKATSRASSKSKATSRASSKPKARAGIGGPPPTDAAVEAFLASQSNPVTMAEIVAAVGEASKTVQAGETAGGDRFLDATLRFVADQRRDGRRASPSALKKLLGIGHARATKLLEQVQALEVAS